LEFHPSIEKADIQEIKIFQEEKLHGLLTYLEAHSPFYQKLFKENNIHIADIRTLEDLQKIPTTTKNDLQQCNHDFFCITPDKIVDYSTTSGTLGDPVTFGLSDNDLERLAYNEAISFACAGIQKGDVVQMITTIDKRFMAGLAYFLGLRKMGASVVRMGPGIPELQWDSIFRYKPKYLITVPSFLLKMIDYAEKHGLDYKNSSVYGDVCIGESIKNQDFTDNILSQKIKEKWDIKKIKIIHRLGKLSLGEKSIMILVSTSHSKDAFEACQFILERIKNEVPIWKKEIFLDGTSKWIDGNSIN